MNLASNVLSDLPKEMPWALGGGTGLFLHLNHRLSFDVDIFFEHPNVLKEIVQNPKTKQITSDWEFPGNYLKLILEKGEINFILASNITDNPHHPYTFKNTRILIETPEEIAAKKIKYRGSKFTLRGTFDLAAIIDLKPDLFVNLSGILELEGSFEKVLQRICFLEKNEKAFPEGMIVTGKESLSKNMFKISVNALKKYLDLDY